MTTTANIEGYASLFGVPDLAGDVVAPGAFARSLAERTGALPVLYQHDTGEPIGILTRAEEDARGLFIAGALNLETRRGAEAASLLAQGALTGLSIGFNIVAAERAEGGARVLTEIELWEVSLVTFPMMPGAQAWPAGGAEMLRRLTNAFAA